MHLHFGSEVGAVELFDLPLPCYLVESHMCTLSPLEPALILCVFLSRMFFKVVLHGGDMELVSQLVPVLIERTVLLFNIPSFQTEMRK